MTTLQDLVEKAYAYAAQMKVRNLMLADLEERNSILGRCVGLQPGTR